MHSALLSLSSPAAFPYFSLLNPPKLRLSIQTGFSKSSSSPFSSIQCSAPSLSIDASPPTSRLHSKTSPAEVSRTIMELSSTGTLSAISPEGYPLGIGARFVVDAQGTPVLCLNEPRKLFTPGGPSSFNVQLEQSRLRTRQCTLLGNLEKLHDGLLLKKLCKRWEKKFGEDVDEALLYVIKVDRILQMEDFMELRRLKEGEITLISNPTLRQPISERQTRDQLQSACKGSGRNQSWGGQRKWQQDQVSKQGLQLPWNRSSSPQTVVA